MVHVPVTTPFFLSHPLIYFPQLLQVHERKGEESKLNFSFLPKNPLSSLKLPPPPFLNVSPPLLSEWECELELGKPPFVWQNLALN
jgi:hypothetical protein